MRTFNFPVDVLPGGGDVIARFTYNPRFSAAEMLNDYPQNMLTPFLSVIRPDGTTFREADGNAVELVATGAAPLENADLAVLLNLLDYGQDFEAERSTTLDKVTIYSPDGGASDVGGLHAALAAANTLHRAAFNEILENHPPADPDYDRGTWPTDMHERYYYWMELDMGQPVPDDAAAMGQALNTIVMWHGLLIDNDTNWAVDGAYSAIASQVVTEGTRIIYSMERPSADPVYAMALFKTLLAERFNLTPTNYILNIGAAD